MATSIFPIFSTLFTQTPLQITALRDTSAEQPDESLIPYGLSLSLNTGSDEPFHHQNRQTAPTRQCSFQTLQKLSSSRQPYKSPVHRDQHLDEKILKTRELETEYLHQKHKPALFDVLTNDLRFNPTILPIAAVSPTILSVFSQNLPLIPIAYISELQTSYHFKDRLIEMQKLMDSLIPHHQLGTAKSSMETIISLSYCVFSLQFRCGFDTPYFHLSVKQRQSGGISRLTQLIAHSLSVSTPIRAHLEQGNQELVTLGKHMRIPSFIAPINPPLAIHRLRTLYKASVDSIPPVLSPFFSTEFSLSHLLSVSPGSPAVSNLYSVPVPIHSSLFYAHSFSFPYTSYTFYQTLPLLQAIFPLHSRVAGSADAEDGSKTTLTSPNQNSSLARLHQFIKLPSRQDENDFSISLALRDIRKKMNTIRDMLEIKQNTPDLITKETDRAQKMESLSTFLLNELRRALNKTEVPNNPCQADSLTLLFPLLERIVFMSPQSPTTKNIITTLVNFPSLLLVKKDEKCSTVGWRIMRHHALRVESAHHSVNHSSASSLISNSTSSSSDQLSDNPFLNAVGSVEFLKTDPVSTPRSSNSEWDQLTPRPLYSVYSEKRHHDIVFETLHAYIVKRVETPTQLSTVLTSQLMPQLALLEGYLINCSTSVSTSLCLIHLAHDLIALRQSVVLTAETYIAQNTPTLISIKSLSSVHPFASMPSLWILSSILISIYTQLALHANDLKSVLVLLLLFFGPPSDPPKPDVFLTLVLSYCLDDVVRSDKPSLVVHRHSLSTGYTPCERQQPFTNFMFLISFLRAGVSLISRLGYTFTGFKQRPSSKSFSFDEDDVDGEARQPIPWPLNFFDSILNPLKGSLFELTSSGPKLFNVASPISPEPSDHSVQSSSQPSGDPLLSKSLPSSLFLPWFKNIGFATADFAME
ncbi:hypothetical protein BLNAU_1533 [Blattamonas nauphoetae]|uniref:Uncharacterized protein n=1 Tax=Blattamonas nauphoetae TaxID=2049346 RepID=A0ABQ9YIA1_9EUKA|nr:hypothetical protein BLNAU_1533 [Blattamonas nauphoetae]